MQFLHVTRCDINFKRITLLCDKTDPGNSVIIVVTMKTQISQKFHYVCELKATSNGLCVLVCYVTLQFSICQQKAEFDNI